VLQLHDNLFFGIKP